MADHWTSRYVGLPFVEGTLDCGEFVRLVQREVFRREVPIPSERWYAGKAGQARLQAMAAQIRDKLPAIARRTVLPVNGDLVMMYSGAKVMHAGVYCTVAGEAWVLHMAERMAQSVCINLRELQGLGYKVEGFYTWT